MSKFKNKEKVLNKLGNHARNIYKKLKYTPKLYVCLFSPQKKKKRFENIKNDFDIIRHPYAVKYPKTDSQLMIFLWFGSSSGT